MKLTLDAAALARKGINKRGARGRQFLCGGAQGEPGEGNGGFDQQAVEHYQQDEEHGCCQPAHDKDQWAIIGGPFADVEFSLRNKRCDHQYARDKTDKDPVGKAGRANEQLQDEVIKLLPIKPSIGPPRGNIFAHPRRAVAADRLRGACDQWNPRQHEHRNHQSRKSKYSEDEAPPVGLDSSHIRSA